MGISPQCDRRRPSAKVHFKRNAHNGNAKDDFEVRYSGVFEQNSADDARQHDDERERNDDSAVEHTSVFPHENDIRGIAQQQFHGRNAGIAFAKAQNGSENERVRKAAQAFDKERRNGRKNPQHTR